MLLWEERKRKQYKDHTNKRKVTIIFCFDYDIVGKACLLKIVGNKSGDSFQKRASGGEFKGKVGEES